jgi:hypothetical protein
VTGEVIDLAGAATSDLARVRDQLVQWERTTLVSAKHAIDDELARRLDYEGRRSAIVGDWKITVAAPTKTAWDGERAHRALRRLVRAGLISHDRAHDCVERVVTYKPKHGALSQLLRHADERVRDAIREAHSEQAVDRRPVTVSPNTRSAA